MSDVSIIIVNWNTRELLSSCLKSIAAADSGGLEIETIVVDNASSDGSATMVSREFPWAMLMASGANDGFAAGVNRGLVMASGRYYLVLNSDTELVGNCLPILVENADEDPRIGIAAPMQVQPPKKRLIRSWYRDPGLLRQLRSVFLIDWIASRRLPRLPLRTRFQTDWVMGAAMLFRAEAADAIGAMDTGLFMYYEDFDYCYRARKAGWKVVLVPEAVILHHGNAAGEQAFSHGRLGMSNRGLRRAYRKHFGSFRGVIMDGLLALDSGLKVILLAVGSLLPAAPGRYARRELREHLAALKMLFTPGSLR